MSLIKCKECGHEISKTADKCPNCGSTMPTTARQIRSIGVALLAVGLIIAGGIFLYYNYYSVRDWNRESRNFTETQKMLNEAISLSIIDWGWKAGEYGSKYLEGVIENKSSKVCRYATITFNLYDKEDIQIGTAFDSVTNIEPRGKWKFKALVTEDNAAKARMASVTGF